MSHLVLLTALVTSQLVVALATAVPATGDRVVALVGAPWQSQPHLAARLAGDDRIVAPGPWANVLVVELDAGWRWDRLVALGALPLRPGLLSLCADGFTTATASVRPAYEERT